MYISLWNENGKKLGSCDSRDLATLVSCSLNEEFTQARINKACKLAWVPEAHKGGFLANGWEVRLEEA